MSDKTNEYLEETLKVIKEKKIAFIDHIWAFTSFSKKTAYNHKLHEVHDIKEALLKNRIKAKNYLLNKWIGGNNSTLNIAAFRLLATKEERIKLNQQYVENTVEFKETPPFKGIDLDE